MSDKNPLKIRQVHHIELYVGNAKQADYFYRHAFGFDRVAYTGLETGNRAILQPHDRLIVDFDLFAIERSRSDEGVVYFAAKGP